ncbi:hypothetical protein TRVL_05166 [Trypanosoma vivax]|nr:hypothetical protein TRVL_05166 [Trypanosoma vivax]
MFEFSSTFTAAKAKAQTVQHAKSKATRSTAIFPSLRQSRKKEGRGAKSQASVVRHDGLLHFGRQRKLKEEQRHRRGGRVQHNKYFEKGQHSRRNYDEVRFSSSFHFALTRIAHKSTPSQLALHRSSITAPLSHHRRHRTCRRLTHKEAQTNATWLGE